MPSARSRSSSGSRRARLACSAESGRVAVLIVAMLHVVADATAGRRGTVARGWLPGGARMLTCKRFFEDAMATSRTVSALLALRGRPQPLEARVEPAENAVIIDGRRVDASELDWDTPAIGCLYGVALNFRGAPRGARAGVPPPAARSSAARPRALHQAAQHLACAPPLGTGPDRRRRSGDRRNARRRHRTGRETRGTPPGRAGDCRLYHRQRHQPPERRTLPSAVARQVPRRVLPSGAVGRTA